MNGVLKTGLEVLDKKLDILDEARSPTPANSKISVISGINEGSYDDTFTITNYVPGNTYSISSLIGGDVSISGNQIIMDYSNINIAQNIEEVLTLGVIEPGKFLHTVEYKFTVYAVVLLGDVALSNPDFSVNEQLNDGWSY